MIKPSLPNIFLVGPLAAGKSTIGRLLAKALKCQFYDTDHEIERVTGVSLAWIFDVEGEAGFHKREEAIVDQLSQISHIVLATGGGSLLSPRSRAILAARGYVIHLQVSLQEQVQRTLRDKHRPLIQTSDRRGALEKLYAEREPLYREVSDWSILTDTSSSARVVHDIYEHLRSHFVVR
jgi:shikimate kinase